MDTALHITRYQEADRRTVLALRGEVDTTTAPHLHRAVMAELSRHDLVLDVTGAVLIDSAGLRVLTAAQREATALGRHPIILRGVRPLLAKTLQSTGLAQMFPREPAPALTRRLPPAPAPPARPRSAPARGTEPLAADRAA